MSDEFDIAEAARPYYDRQTDDAALQAVRERIEEWDFSIDPHGYCHERPVLIALLRMAERRP